MGGLRKPNQRRRTLHWDALPTHKLEGTFWSGAALPDSSEGDAVDLTALESLFTSTVAPKKKGDEDGKPAGGLQRRQSMNSGRTVVTLLDMKRASNVEIVVSQIKKPLVAIADAIATMNISVLSSDDVESLIKYIPEKDELDSIRQFVSEMAAMRAAASPGKASARGPDDIAAQSERDVAHALGMMGKAEQLFYHLGSVPRLKARLEAMQFQHVFVAQEHAIRSQLGVIHSATTELVTSPRFRRLLEIVLALGNSLNARAPVRGFKLSSLPKLMDTRSFDNKTTLLHFLVAHLESTPELATLLEVRRELEHVQPASRLLFSTLEADLKALGGGMAAVQSELEASGSNADGPLAAFGAEASSALDTCREALAASREAFLTCLRFYGEDDTKGVTPDEPERFLGLVHSWILMLEKCVQERHKVKQCAEAGQKDEAREDDAPKA